MDDAQVAKLIRLVAMLAPWGAVKGEPLQLPDDTDLHELAGIARELLVHVAEHPIGAMAIKQRQAIEHRWMVAARKAVQHAG